MQALFVTVRFTELPPSTQRDLAHLSRRFATLDGHLDTIWLRNGSTIALHQTFESASAAQRYVAGGMLRELAALPECRDLFVQEFEVLEGLDGLPATRATADEVPAEDLVAVG